jgi:hypothetical protein
MPASILFPGEYLRKEVRNTMPNFLATDRPVPRLTAMERILLYGIGCKALLLTFIVLDRMLSELYGQLDERNPERCRTRPMRLGDSETAPYAHEGVE